MNTDASVSGIRADETHGIALSRTHRLLAHSEGRPWKNVYASLASERSWSGTLPPAPHHCVVYCLNQAAHVQREIDGWVSTTSKLLPRRLGIIPGKVGSHWDVRGNPDILLLYLRSSMVEELVADSYGEVAADVSIIPRTAFVDPTLEQLALTVLDGLSGRRHVADAIIDAMANAMAARLVSDHMQIGTSSAEARFPQTGTRMQRLLSHIDAAPDDELTLPQLAREANLSPDHLIRAFKRELGVTPHQYIMQRRIDRARKLLASTNMPLAELAQAAGFSDQSHLTTAFRKAVGVSPARYRRHEE